jgi:hypothetical protein
MREPTRGLVDRIVITVGSQVERTAQLLEARQTVGAQHHRFSVDRETLGPRSLAGPILSALAMAVSISVKEK